MPDADRGDRVLEVLQDRVEPAATGAGKLVGDLPGLLGEVSEPVAAGGADRPGEVGDRGERAHAERQLEAAVARSGDGVGQVAEPTAGVAEVGHAVADDALRRRAEVAEAEPAEHRARLTEDPAEATAAEHLTGKVAETTAAQHLTGEITEIPPPAPDRRDHRAPPPNT